MTVAVFLFSLKLLAFRWIQQAAAPGSGLLLKSKPTHCGLLMQASLQLSTVKAAFGTPNGEDWPGVLVKLSVQPGVVDATDGAVEKVAAGHISLT